MSHYSAMATKSSKGKVRESTFLKGSRRIGHPFRIPSPPTLTSSDATNATTGKTPTKNQNELRTHPRHADP
jgi:hypothetical protein